MTLVKPLNPAPKLTSKANSKLMRFTGWLVKPINPTFMTNYWTTIGNTIYYPTSETMPQHRHDILQHEFVHVHQWRKYHIWFWFSYLFLPVPFGFAWYRYKWEREAYLVDIKARRLTVDQVARTLSSSTYGWAWPEKWIKEWLHKRLDQDLLKDLANKTNPGAFS